jgi:hypothetical protein
MLVDAVVPTSMKKQKLSLQRHTIRQLQSAAIAKVAGARDDRPWEPTGTKVMETCPATLAAPCETIWISCRLCA